MKEEKIKVEITGMTCDHCAASIEKLVKTKEGVTDVKVNWKDGKGAINFNSDKISEDEIADTINNTKNYKVKSITYSNLNTSHFDLIIIGGGSAAFAAAIKANESGLTTLIVNGGLPIGGTCVNVGCLPSKHLIRAAEQVHRASHSAFTGIKPCKPETDFLKIIQQKKELVKVMQQKKYLDVVSDFETLKIIEGKAKFLDEKTILVNDKDEYTADKFLIATGATTNIQNIEGLKEVGYLTNVSLFDLEEKPESLTIMGAGYIGLEIAMAYNRFGIKIRIIEFTDRAIRTQTPDISEELEKFMKEEGIEFYPNYRIEKVEKNSTDIIIKGKDVKTGKDFQFTEHGHIVVATGTTPNTKDLGVENLGIATLKSGHIIVNEFMQTSVPHIYAAGDCNQNPPFVYTAAYEGNLAVNNMVAHSEEELSAADYKGMPWVIFTDPQVAGAGIDEAEAEKKNIPFEVSKINLSDVPRYAAALDTRGFIKLIRNSETDKLLGARIIAPEGGELVMELSLAIRYGITVTELAKTMHPYLTASEGIKLAAITFGKDVAKLSCCAV
ncbi:MAG: mercury(II) reductase [Bacteroidetes bacterium]|nr:mercury(II) reductase [Bacteroidota bacterium]